MRRILLTLSGLICGFLLLVCPNSYAECQSTEDAVIKNDDGDVVYLVSKVCDGIAASEEGSIDLALQGEMDPPVRTTGTGLLVGKFAAPTS